MSSNDNSDNSNVNNNENYPSPVRMYGLLMAGSKVKLRFPSTTEYKKYINILRVTKHRQDELATSLGLDVMFMNVSTLTAVTTREVGVTIFFSEESNKKHLFTHFEIVEEADPERLDRATLYTK